MIYLALFLTVVAVTAITTALMLWLRRRAGWTQPVVFALSAVDVWRLHPSAGTPTETETGEDDDAQLPLAA